MTDNVNHPQHYEKHKIVLEPIDIIENLPFTVANVLKYAIRAYDKGSTLEDYRKAKWYHRRAVSTFSHEKLNEILAPLAVLRFSDNAMLRDFGRQIFNGREPWLSWNNLGVWLNRHIYALLDEHDTIPEELRETGEGNEENLDD